MLIIVLSFIFKKCENQKLRGKLTNEYFFISVIKEFGVLSQLNNIIVLFFFSPAKQLLPSQSALFLHL